MSNRFDDMIRKQLEKQESAVPASLFDKIRNHPDVQDAMFDGVIKSKVLGTESSVAAGAFEKIEIAADLPNLAFDSFINQKLENAESSVPADMWERIQQKKDRRRPVAIWWIAAAFFGLIGIGSWLWLNHKSQTNASVVIKNSEGITLTPHSVKTIVDANKTTPDTSENNKSEEVATTTIQPAQSEFTSPINSSEPGQRDLYLNNMEKAKSNRANNKDLSNQLYRSPGGLDGYSSVSELKSDLSSGGNSLENVDAVKHSFTLQELLNKTAGKPGQLLHAKALKPLIPCPSTGDENRNDWYIDIYSSALLLQKKVTDNLGSKNAASGFDSTLHQQVSFNAGVSVVKNMGNNFLLKTGVQYNRINEAFRVTRINERRLITTISIRTVILSPGDTVYIKDTSTVEQIGTVKQTHQNTYTQLDIPVIFGYEFGGKNIRLNVNAGLIANIRSSYKGLLLDTLQQAKDINNIGGNAAYRRNVGFSFYAGLSVVKPITNTLNIFIEPHARIGLTNQANEQMWFRQKNTMMGLSVGIRYKLNNSRQRIY